LHEAFERQASQTPDAIALYDHAGSIRYADLAARSTAAAAALSRRGLRHVPIGVSIDRSIDYVIAVLGVLKADCFVLPLAPSYPRARLDQIVSFVEPAAIITNAPGDSGFAAELLLSLSGLVGESAFFSPGPSDPAQPAFLLSSSGSTGRPKTIVRSHRSFFHRLHWTWSRHPFAPDEVCVQKSHMTTTHAIYEFFEPLLRGVPTHIVGDEAVRNLDDFWQSVRDRRVTRLLLVPSMLQTSLDTTSVDAPDLKVLVLMGERVPPGLAERTIQTFGPNTHCYSIYGSTEASSVLVCDIRADYRQGQELVLGTPISADVQAGVFDEAFQPVPHGSAGMLYIAGPALFTEYYRDAELTAAVTATRDGTRWYRTQDEVRRLPGDALEFIGRVDDTVKVRGFRVDLREVERTIAAHPDVRQCVVLPTSNDGGDASLVVFLTPSNVTPNVVLDHARAALPAYMVPSAVVCVDAVPLTASGKIDRRRLLAEYAAQSSATPSFDSETERRIAEVWRGVLGHARFGRDSSFLEVGGTSLTVFAAAHRLRVAFQLERDTLSDGTIYQHPTLGGLASYVDAVRSGGAVASAANSILVTLKQGSDRDLPPLFLIASAGGTLGAYAKLVQALRTRREVVGIRDPFLWGGRDATLGFGAWVGAYRDALLARQSAGPFHLVGYSSAGAFTFELARQLRALGHEVQVLALIDPLALDRRTKSRYGYWALEARFGRLEVARVIRLVGTLRRLLPRWLVDRADDADIIFSPADFQQLWESARSNCGHIRAVAALLELNTGLPFRMDASETPAGGRTCLDAFLEKIQSVAPETDLEMMERLVVQYELQVRTQHRYRLRPYGGTVHLFEPESPFRGLEAAQLGPYVARLHARGFPVAESANGSVLDDVFPERIRTHYLCMRDDVFVGHLARALDDLLVAN
jgi:acyl-CoA synthetase (AMP-forming)/AMP-acid ligase II